MYGPLCVSEKYCLSTFQTTSTLLIWCIPNPTLRTRLRVFSHTSPTYVPPVLLVLLLMLEYILQWCVHVHMWLYLGKPTSQRENQLSRTHGNTRSSKKTLMEIKKKKRVLLVDGESEWLQIWMAASSLNVKGNKGNLFFLLTGWFSQIRTF